VFRAGAVVVVVTAGAVVVGIPFPADVGPALGAADENTDVPSPPVDAGGAAAGTLVLVVVCPAPTAASLGGGRPGAFAAL